MAWVQVHEDLLHSVKLRRLAKQLSCSRNEAMGILVSLWLFAVSTADTNGLIECVSPEDIYNSDPQKTYPPERVTAALLQSGFLDRGNEPDSYIVHDWAYWQSVWITEKRRRDERARHMRELREREREEKE